MEPSPGTTNQLILVLDATLNKDPTIKDAIICAATTLFNNAQPENKPTYFWTFGANRTIKLMNEANDVRNEINDLFEPNGSEGNYIKSGNLQSIRKLAAHLKQTASPKTVEIAGMVGANFNPDIVFNTPTLRQYEYLLSLFQ
jgi:hypothetical protein